MKTSLPLLGVERITLAARPSQRGPRHAARLVIDPADHAIQSPFLLLAEDWFAPPAGFPTHPHRGMETVTFVLEGSLEHRDHTGASGSLDAGDVQFMTAGSGVMHSEMPGPSGVHSLQLWLNLPAAKKGADPAYRDIRASAAATICEGGATLRLYTGALQSESRPFASQWPMTLVDVTLEPGASATIEVPAKNRAFGYMLEGENLRVSEDHTASKGAVIWFEVSNGSGSAIALTASQHAAARLLIYAAETIEEPVVFGGPFVMNTQAEIDLAFDDLTNGRLIVS